MVNWEQLQEEIQRWNDVGKKPSLWWRDDDAETDTDALRRLSALSIDAGVPLNLAVIPQGVSKSLLPVFADNPLLFAMQHGYSHLNHAPADERKHEFGDHRSIELIGQELQTGLKTLESLLASRFVAAMVPPWNRIGSEVLSRLASLGFSGISTLNPRKSETLYSLIQVNVHVDLIDWRQREFSGEDRVLAQLLGHLQARREGSVDAQECTGVMSHHLAHDEGCWHFLEKLLVVCDKEKVDWLAAPELFTSRD